MELALDAVGDVSIQALDQHHMVAWVVVGRARRYVVQLGLPRGLRSFA